MEQLRAELSHLLGKNSVVLSASMKSGYGVVGFV